jgi:membrane associated rhomboid family serine protease
VGRSLQFRGHSGTLAQARGLSPTRARPTVHPSRSADLSLPRVLVSMLATMKSSGGKPKVIFDPIAGRFVRPPKREATPRTPRGVLVALWGWAGCILLGAIAGFVFLPGDVGAWMFGALLGFVVGIVLILLASLIRRALRRSP